jgi:hypothetical protein
MDLAPDFDEFIGCLTAHGVETRVNPCRDGSRVVRNLFALKLQAELF